MYFGQNNFSQMFFWAWRIIGQKYFCLKPFSSGLMWFCQNYYYSNASCPNVFLIKSFWPIVLLPKLNWSKVFRPMQFGRLTLHLGFLVYLLHARLNAAEYKRTNKQNCNFFQNDRSAVVEPCPEKSRQEFPQ